MIKKIIKLILFSMGSFAGLFRRRKCTPHPRRIFILASGYLGDTFWAVQTIPLLKKKYPDAELYIGGKPFISDLCYNLIPEEKQIFIRSVISDRHRETVSAVSPSISHEVMGPDAMIFVF